MGAIVKFEIDKFSEWLVPQKVDNHVAIVECLDKMQSKKYKDLSDKDSFDLLYACIKQVWRLRNMGIPTFESIEYEIKQLNRELLKNKKYANLTVDELGFIFNHGGLGKLNEGEFIKNEVFFSVSNYFSWIEKYYKTIRAQAEILKIKYNKIYEIQLDEKRSHEEYITSINQIVYVMNDWNNHKEFSITMLASMFNILRKEGLSIPTKEEYEDIKLTGFAVYKNLENQEKQEKRLLPYNKEDFCRHLCLHHFYKKWKQQGKRLVIDNEQLKLV